MHYVLILQANYYLSFIIYHYDITLFKLISVKVKNNNKNMTLTLIATVAYTVGNI